MDDNCHEESNTRPAWIGTRKERRRIQSMRTRGNKNHVIWILIRHREKKETEPASQTERQSQSTGSRSTCSVYLISEGQSRKSLYVSKYPFLSKPARVSRPNNTGKKGHSTNKDRTRLESQRLCVNAREERRNCCPRLAFHRLIL